MNKNKNNKVKEFLRKEGFYVVLFICLCVVATVATFTLRSDSTSKQENQSNDEFTLNVDESTASLDDASNIQMRNAERVELDDEVADISENEVAEATETEVADLTEEVAEYDQTSEVMAEANSEIIFSLPVEGAIARNFDVMIRTYEDSTRTEDNTRRGIDLSATVGSVVFAAAEGQVEEISNNVTDGTYVVISHANGLKTKYANLSEEVNVAVGDMVEAGTEIGTVGNTSSVFTSEICGDVVNLQVMDSNGNDLNPEEYFNFQ